MAGETNKQSRAFLYASLGPLILQQLAADATCADVFPAPVLEIIAAKKAPTPEELKTAVEAFLDRACPSRKDCLPVVRWVCRQYLQHRHNGKPVLAEDLSKIGDNIRYFDGLKNSAAFREAKNKTDLTQYKTYAEFEATIDPFLKRQQQKQAVAAAFNMKPEERAAIMAETTVLYAGPEGTVVVAHTIRASQHWGSNTKWCLAGQKTAAGAFPGYNKRSPVIMILPKGMPDKKVALVDHKLWNSEDHTVDGLPQAHYGLLHACLGTLSPGARDGLAPWLPAAVEKILDDDNAAEPAEENPPAKKPGINIITDRDEALAAIRKNGRALIRLSTNLRDREMCLMAIAQRASAFDGVVAPLRQDHGFILEAMQANGGALEHVPDRFRRDRDIVTAAVKQDGLALQYASQGQRQRRGVVRAAVLQNAKAFEYATRKLRQDPDFVRGLLEDGAGDLAFCIRDMKYVRYSEPGVWQPDDAELQGFQIKALQKMVAAGDRRKFAACARHFKAVWGDPEKLFGGDMDAAIRAIMAEPAPAPRQTGQKPAL